MGFKLQRPVWRSRFISLWTERELQDGARAENAPQGAGDEARRVQPFPQAKDRAHDIERHQQGESEAQAKRGQPPANDGRGDERQRSKEYAAAAPAKRYLHMP